MLIRRRTSSMPALPHSAHRLAELQTHQGVLVWEWA